MNEADLQALVTDAAQTFGWWRAHFRPARTTHGWRVPGQYEAGEGWPDLLLLRGGEVLVWELKGVGGQVTDEQWEWLATWDRVPGAECAVVSPHNVDDYALPRLMGKPVPAQVSGIIGTEHVTGKGRVKR